VTKQKQVGLVVHGIYLVPFLKTKYPVYESHLILWQNYGKQNLILPDFEGKFTEIIRLKS
jgi:hypothetical protein